MAITFIVKRVEPILTLDTVAVDCTTVENMLISARHIQAAGKACSKIDSFFSKDTKFATVGYQAVRMAINLPPG